MVAERFSLCFQQGTIKYYQSGNLILLPCTNEKHSVTEGAFAVSILLHVFCALQALNWESCYNLQGSLFSSNGLFNTLDRYQEKAGLSRFSFCCGDALLLVSSCDQS